MEYYKLNEALMANSAQDTSFGISTTPFLSEANSSSQIFIGYITMK